MAVIKNIDVVDAIIGWEYLAPKKPVRTGLNRFSAVHIFHKL